MEEEPEEPTFEEEPPVEPESEEEAVEEEAPPPPEEPVAARGSIPIMVSVEVGRLQMSADKVLSLEPGNLLELDRAPGERVDLISGGKKIGSGELLRVGDVLGIRILELG